MEISWYNMTNIYTDKVNSTQYTVYHNHHKCFISFRVTKTAKLYEQHHTVGQPRHTLDWLTRVAGTSDCVEHQLTTCVPHSCNAIIRPRQYATTSHRSMITIMLNAVSTSKNYKTENCVTDSVPNLCAHAY